MKNSEWLAELKRQGIYGVITRTDITTAQMADLLSAGRDPKKIQCKIEAIMSCLSEREKNPNGIII